MKDQLESFDHDFVLQNIVMHAPSIDRDRSLHPNHNKIHQIMIGKWDNNPAKISRSSNHILHAPKVRRVHCDPTKDRSDANAQYTFSMSPPISHYDVSQQPSTDSLLLSQVGKPVLVVCAATSFASVLALVLVNIDLAEEKTIGWNHHHQPRVGHHRHISYPFAQAMI